MQRFYIFSSTTHAYVTNDKSMKSQALGNQISSSDTLLIVKLRDAFDRMISDQNTTLVETVRKLLEFLGHLIRKNSCEH